MRGVCVFCARGKNIFPSERVVIQYLHSGKFIISSYSSEYGVKSGNADANTPNLGIADTDFYIITSSQCIYYLILHPPDFNRSSISERINKSRMIIADIAYKSYIIINVYALCRDSQVT